VEAVAGDLVELKVLAGTGVDPHDYEMSAADRRDIENTHVLVRFGHGVDAFANGTVPDSRTLTLTDRLTLRSGAADTGEDRGHDEDDDHGHDEDDDHGHEGDDDHAHEDEEDDHGHSHGDRDAHVWHDPENNKVMARQIAEDFAARDPRNADTYQQNAEAFAARMDDVDRQIRELINGIPESNRKMVTNHDAFGYFINRYGLTYVGAVIPSTTTAAEPSARQIANLSDTIRRENVKAIFAESSLDPAVARQIANDTGVKIVDDLYGDTLGEPDSGAETIEGMLLANARKIAEALR
jgi:zinc/manganese transport system substrate-binding protein